MSISLGHYRIDIRGPVLLSGFVPGFDPVEHGLKFFNLDNREVVFDAC